VLPPALMVVYLHRWCRECERERECVCVCVCVYVCVCVIGRLIKAMQWCRCLLGFIVKTQGIKRNSLLQSLLNFKNHSKGEGSARPAAAQLAAARRPPGRNAPPRQAHTPAPKGQRSALTTGTLQRPKPASTSPKHPATLPPAHPPYADTCGSLPSQVPPPSPPGRHGTHGPEREGPALLRLH
jgi:hypothetical protein